MVAMLIYTINTKNALRCLDSFLGSLAPGGSGSYFRKLIKSGAVKVNNVQSAHDQILRLNDQVSCKESSLFTRLLTDIPPVFDILYEDQQIVAVNKPAGLAMHRTAELENNLVDVGTDFMEWRGTSCKLYPVNRLDRGTSGVVILAKSSSNAGIYGRQVKETGLDKLYLALVPGLPEEYGVITTPLDDKESETRYRIAIQGNNGALLAVKPISGRTHQIRRHLEGIGHPVVGDKRYGGGIQKGYNGFALHSFRTILMKPDGEKLMVYAPIPEGWGEMCQRYNISPERFAGLEHIDVA